MGILDRGDVKLAGTNIKKTWILGVDPGILRIFTMRGREHRTTRKSWRHWAANGRASGRAAEISWGYPNADINVYVYIRPRGKDPQEIK